MLPSFLFSSETLSEFNKESKSASENEKEILFVLKRSPEPGTRHLGQRSRSLSRFSGKQIKPELLICKCGIWENFLEQVKQAHATLQRFNECVLGVPLNSLLLVSAVFPCFPIQDFHACLKYFTYKAPRNLHGLQGDTFSARDTKYTFNTVRESWNRPDWVVLIINKETHFIFIISVLINWGLRERQE